jgi:hypothetical protein
MAQVEYNQVIETSYDVVAQTPISRIATPTVCAVPFVEYPAQPLDDADRDAFLELMEDESEPNQTLLAAAKRFKACGF